MSDKRICPLLSMAAALTPLAEFDQAQDHHNFGMCCEHLCAMWATVYTTEGLNVSDCAYALTPHMNSDGRYAV